MLLLPHAAALLLLDRASGTCMNKALAAARPWRARATSATILPCRSIDRPYLPEASTQRARDKFPAGPIAGRDHTNRPRPVLHPNPAIAISNRQSAVFQIALRCAQYPYPRRAEPWCPASAAQKAN